MGSLNTMNFITRLSALCLRKNKMQHRHQSNRRPAVPLGSRILTDPSKGPHAMVTRRRGECQEKSNRELSCESSVRRTSNTPGTFLYCCDFASGAVELVKSHSSYNSAWCSAFVHDVCDDALPYPFPDEILDVILLVFVLSTIHPDRMQGVVNRLAKLLKPGGMLLFRDYGRYDTAQLRFKEGHCLSENFYVRGDGTRVYFFTKDEVQNMFNLAGLTEVQNLVDRRLQVNRKKKVKMQRVWIQSKFQKPLLSA